MSTPLARDIARILRAPIVPDVVRRLDEIDGFLDHVWPELAPSVDSTGFLGSALYMADMALDAVEAVYEPLLTRASLVKGGLIEDEIERIAGVLDVFHWLHPQLLLALAAVAEAWDRPEVGGQGRGDRRETLEREEAHLATRVPIVDPSEGLLPEIAVALGLDEAPELYRAVAAWPRYLEPAWDELQHLVAYPDFRRRGRALYFYARSGARFLARPLRANPESLRAAGMDEAGIERAKRLVDGALPALATMTMHTNAMRVSLGIRTREVVQS